MIKLTYSDLEPYMPFFSRLWVEWRTQNNPNNKKWSFHMEYNVIWNTIYSSTKEFVPTENIKNIYD